LAVGAAIVSVMVIVAKARMKRLVNEKENCIANDWRGSMKAVVLIVMELVRVA
jgi:hypothetical protein